MIPKSFAGYHQIRVRRIRALLTQASRHHTVAAVHDLRVEIKRLRAFHKLIAASAPQPPSPDLWKPLRKLFRAAARLRDYQVQWGLVLGASRTAGNLSEYLNFLKEQEIHCRTRFSRVSCFFSTEAFSQLYAGARAAMQPYRAEKVIALTSTRLEAALDELVQLRREEPFDSETLHRIRILGKEARYVLELLRFQAPPDDWYDRLDQALKTMHQTLGRWHDAVVGQQYVAEFLRAQAVRPLFEPVAYEKLDRLLESSRAQELAGFGHHWAALTAVLADQRDLPALR
jgi:CHAD domain-containing protein